MANEYAVNQADLTAVADAIREKGGTSDSLTFPGGFVDAVGAIQASNDDMAEKMFTRQTNDIVIPDGFTYIGPYVFYSWTDLAITLPETITTFGRGAFWLCRNLNLTRLPSGITEITDDLFRDCTNMPLEFIPDGVTAIKGNAFASCNALKFTELPDSVLTLSGSAFRNAKIPLTRLSNNLVSIGDWCFGENNLLALEEIPESVTKIFNHAFIRCTSLNIKSIPKNVVEIQNSAFESCTGLTEITFKGTPTSIGATTFKNCTNLTTINVPWAEGAVANAPWGATNATINYNYTGG